MIDPQRERKTAVEYCLMRRLLRPGGVWSIIFGAIAITALAVGGVESAGDVAVLVLGLLLLVEGLWILKAPSPAMLLVECGLFVLIAAWNIHYTITAVSAGAGDVGPWPFIACVQIWVAVDFYKKYRRFAHLANVEPAKPLCEEFDRLIKRVKRGNPRKDEALIMLTAFLGKWKAGLFGDEILLVHEKGQDLCLATRDEVRLTSEGKVALGKDIKVVLEIGDRQWKGQISQEQFDRIEEWRTRQPEPARTF